MPVEWTDVLVEQHQRIEAERAQYLAELEAARHSFDTDRINAASDAVLLCDLKQDKLNVRTQQFVAAQTPREGHSRYGLNKDELDVAHSHPDPNLSRDQKEQLYAHNRGRYRQARQDGSYRDDQGRV